jgi:hypothetical protein
MLEMPRRRKVYTMKKYYKFVDTEAGELPVVGDEVLLIQPENGRKWSPLDDEDIKDWEYDEAPINLYLIRRELHPQEMAKECAENVFLTLEDHFFIQHKAGKEKADMIALILPHIQAALEGK